MKNLILTILASSFILSCSTDSGNDNTNNSSSTGMLVKTVTTTRGTSSTTDVYSYNGNKINGWVSSDGANRMFTYNGDYIVNYQYSVSPNRTGTYSWLDNQNYGYSNGLLISSYSHYSHFSQSTPEDFFISTINSTFTYNSDGTRIENQTITYLGGTISHIAIKEFYSQGNCIKQEEYNKDNSPMTLNSTTTYTYDTKNTIFKNISGFKNLTKYVNNKIGHTVKDDSGNVIETSLSTYQYNSQGYPISETRTSTTYTINPQTGASTPGAPTISTETYTYY